MIEVSIVIPAYNAAKTLAEAVASLQAQTFEAWEAIVVDDGSTDDTLSIANRLAVAEQRLRVISQSNHGVSAARNAGIDSARAEWLLFLDADDWLLPMCLERMLGCVAADRQL